MASNYESLQFAVIFLYFPSKNQAGTLIYALIKCKLYLVVNLSVNILMRNDVLALEQFIININKQCAFIESYRVTIPITAWQHGQFLRKKLLASKEKVVPPCSNTMISLLPVSLPNDHDFLFHLAAQANLIIYTYIVDHETPKVLVRNTSDCPLQISHYYKLGHIIDISYKSYFLAEPKEIFPQLNKEFTPLVTMLVTLLTKPLTKCTVKVG